MELIPAPLGIQYCAVHQYSHSEDNMGAMVVSARQDCYPVLSCYFIARRYVVTAVLSLIITLFI